jgi:hypothetical protein
MSRDQITETKRRLSVEEFKELRAHMRQYESAYARLEVLTLTGVLGLYGILFGQLTEPKYLSLRIFLLLLAPAIVWFSMLRSLGYYLRVRQIGAYIKRIEDFVYKSGAGDDATVQSLGWENHLNSSRARFKEAFLIINASYWIMIFGATLFVAYRYGLTT